MRTAWIWLALALLFVPGVPAAPMPGAPGPAPVRADFSDAVAAAEAGWREDVCGALRAYASRLLDAERAATREEDLDAANRIRDLRRSVERLVSEVAAFESLVGLVPVPGGNAVEGAARVAHAACRETVDAANGRYAAALKKAASAASAALDIRMGSATDEADLDRANALADAKRNVDREVKLRMTPLVWWDISFPTRTLFAFRGDDYQWRVEIGRASCRERV